MAHGSWLACSSPPLPSPPSPNSQPASQPELPLGLSLAIGICLSPGCSRDNTRGERFNAENMPRVVRCWHGLMHCLPYHPVCRPRLRAKSLDSLNKRFWLGICYRGLGVLGVGGMEARQLPNRVINSRQMHAGTVVPFLWRVASCEPFLRSATKHCLCCGHTASLDNPHKGATDRLHCPGYRFRILISEAWNLQLNQIKCHLPGRRVSKGQREIVAFCVKRASRAEQEQSKSRLRPSDLS
jgi:hypothetical protein